MSSDNRVIKYALVHFLKDSIKKIVSVNFIIFDRKNETSFKPQTSSDYDPKHKYYVKWYYCGDGGDICSGDNECDHPHDFYSAFITYLSETRNDIEMQLESGKRMPVTNRKYVTTTTESDEDDKETDEVTKFKEKTKINEAKKKAALNKRSCIALKKLEMAFTPPTFSDFHEQENESHKQKNENNGIGQIMTSKSKIQLKDVRVNLENITPSTLQSNKNDNSSKQGQQISHDKHQEYVSSPQISELSTPTSSQSSQKSSRTNSLQRVRIPGLKKSLFNEESDTETGTPSLQNENGNEDDEHTGEHESPPHNNLVDDAADRRNNAGNSAVVRQKNIHKNAASGRHNTREPGGGHRNNPGDNGADQHNNPGENADDQHNNPGDNGADQHNNPDDHAADQRNNPDDDGADQHNNPDDHAADQRNHADEQLKYTRSNDFLLSCIFYYERAREGHALREKQQRYTVRDNGEIYLGENITIDKTAWEFLQVERPSSFLVTVAKHLWGGSLNLANRAFDLTHGVDNIPGRSPVKLIENNLLRLLISLYYDFLKRNKALTSTERAKLMSQAIDDVRYSIRNLRSAEKRKAYQRDPDALARINERKKNDTITKVANKNLETKRMFFYIYRKKCVFTCR